MWVIIVFLIALLFRVISLGSIPVGFHADEVRVGWNAYSIMKTGMDDTGNRLALYYNTFGDFRPTGIFYLTIPSLAVFGLNEFAVRFPSALIGALTVFPLYQLTLLISKDKKMARLAALLLALTPWHWIVSRATSEVAISMFCALWGLVFLIKALKKGSTKLFIVSAVSLSIGCLFYHSIRVLAPLFVFATLFYYWKTLSTPIKKKAIAMTVALILFVCTLLLTKGSFGRFQQVSIAKTLDSSQQVLGDHVSKTTLFTRIRDEYARYLSSDFLLGEAAKPYRYRVFGVSLLGSAILLFIVAGVVAIAQKKASSLPLLLLLLSPLPAAVTVEDSPNLHRALFMVPFFMIIAASGVLYLFKQRTAYKLVAFLLLCLFSVTSLQSAYSYFASGKLDSAPYRNFGVDELIGEINARQNEYDRVIVTNQPDSPYPWYAFYNHLDPQEFNAAARTRTAGEWTYKNITFTQNRCPAGATLEKGKTPISILAIDGAGCSKDSILNDVPGSKVLREINGPNGVVEYRIWELIR